MITVKDIETVTKDVFDAYEDFLTVQYRTRKEKKYPDEMFKVKIVNRLKELVTVAENIEARSWKEQIQLGMR